MTHRIETAASGEGFTPGPWACDRDLPHNRMPRVHGGDRSLICEVGNMGTTQDQWEANACLIAAAPDLYAASTALIAAHDANDVPAGEVAVRNMRAAIAKARG